MSSTAKPLKYLVLHCSATPEGRDVRPEDIIVWHERRWGKGARGYRTFVTLDGKAHKLRDANLDALVQPSEMTWGARGVNSVSHHICYAGGVDKNMDVKDTRTEAQKDTLLSIVKFYIKEMNPAIRIAPHYAFSLKGCPSFNTVDWLRENGIDDKNIEFRDPYKVGQWLRQIENRQ